MMAEVSLLAKVTFVLAVTLIGTRLLHGARASVRALVLSSAFGVLLALPVAGLLIPERSVEISVSYAANFPRVLEQVDTALPAMPATGTGAETVAAQWRMPPVASLLRALWALVATGLLLRLGLALWRLGAIRRTGVSWPGGDELTATLAADAGLRRRVDLFLHEDLSAPMTFGLRRPAIGLPRDAPGWSRAALHHALVHELEHVRRGDWPVHLVARCACALYWFHPLAWIAARQLCLEAERTCDDAVLRAAERTAYAEQLVSLARRLSKSDPAAVLSMAARSDLSARVRAVLDPHQARGRAGLLCGVLITASAAVLTLAISPLQAVSRFRDVAAPTVQSVQAQTLTFEVASIRPNNSATWSQTIGRAGNTFIARNVTLEDLIYAAFRPDELSGGPDWIDSERYDIEAKPEREADWDQQMVMLQTLLADRFSLVVRRETRQAPAYALVVGRNGPTLTAAADANCPSPPSEKCGGFRTRPGQFVGRRVTLSQVAALLSGPRSGRLVLNNTGIEGFFDVQLTWTPDVGQLPSGPSPDDVPPFDPSGPSLFTAIDEQLGLRLEPTIGPVQHLIIEGAERPTSNDAPEPKDDPTPQAPAAPRQLPEGLPQGLEALVDSPTTGPDAPRFDAASIRRSTSRDNFNGAQIYEGGRFRATNSTLVRLVQIAYGLRPMDPVLEGPSWARIDGYDVEAAPERRVSVTQARLMIRTLLAERFNLVVRTTPREMPAYALLVAREDRRLGSQVARPTGDCINPGLALARAANGAPERIPDLSMLGPQPPIGQPGRHCGMTLGTGSVKGGSVSMTTLVTLLRQSVDRPVVDRTGLSGTFDFDLQFAAVRGRGLLSGTLSPDVAPPPDAGDAPSIFTALQEQLGLKLEPTRALVDVLVIDRAERPTEN